MIEIKDCVNSDEIILTEIEYENVKLNKQFKLRKRDKKAILRMLSLRSVEVMFNGECMANRIFFARILNLRPSIRKFRRYRMFNEMAYDVENILHSDNVEFNLVKYFNMVCHMDIKELADCLECKDLSEGIESNFSMMGSVEFEF